MVSELLILNFAFRPLSDEDSDVPGDEDTGLDDDDDEDSDDDSSAEDEEKSFGDADSDER